MSERVPEDWSVSNLGQHIDILSGFPFKSSEFTNDPSDFGLIRIRDLLDQKLETFYAGEYSTDFIVKIGDILIGMDGDFHIVKWKSQNALLNQRICKLVPKKGGFDINFVHYFLIPELEKIHNQTTATTVKHLTIKDIREVEQAFPPLAEQKKIASILTSVDEVIEGTQKQIDKLQDLKKATMNELLTKGIGHTEFKDSELGKIPKSWEVKRLETVSSFRRGSFPQPYGKPEWYDDNGHSFVQVYDIDSNRQLKPNTKSKISDKAAEMSVFIPTGSLLVSLQGSIGRVAITQYDAYVDRTVLIFSNFNSHLDRVFFSLIIERLFAKQKEVADGGIIKTITKETLKDFQVCIPPIEEQTKIANGIQSLEFTIQQRFQKLIQTQSLKKSLMQDLLTGKVRVQVN